jgi:hypothetical protein
LTELLDSIQFLEGYLEYRAEFPHFKLSRNEFGMERAK